MLITIPSLLPPNLVDLCRNALEQADWVDGRRTAGHIAVRAKNNLQLPIDHPVGAQIGEVILQALSTNPLFISAVLPLHILPPRFNRYEDGANYGNHIDNAIFNIPGTQQRLRTDVSTTVFLSDPEDYDGGELIIQDNYGEHSIKLASGDAVVYPGTSLHRVSPVTRGVRLASFFWIQSMVRLDHQRTLLYELDNSIQTLAATNPNSETLPRFSGIYHNLLREWSTT